MKNNFDLRSSTLNEGRVNSACRAARELLNKSFQWPQESLWGVIIAEEVKNPFRSATAERGLERSWVAGSLLPTAPLRKGATSWIRPFFNLALSHSSPSRGAASDLGARALHVIKS